MSLKDTFLNQFEHCMFRLVCFDGFYCPPLPPLNPIPNSPQIVHPLMDRRQIHRRLDDLLVRGKLLCVHRQQERPRLLMHLQQTTTTIHLLVNSCLSPPLRSHHPPPSPSTQSYTAPSPSTAAWCSACPSASPPSTCPAQLV